MTLINFSFSNSIVTLSLILLFHTCFGFSNHHYLNQWAVRIRGGQENADRLARELDYINRGQIPNFKDTYIMEKIDHPGRSKRDARHLTKRLTDDVRVVWAEQQIAKRRDKRADDISRIRLQEERFNDPLWSKEWYLQDTRDLNAYDLPKLDLNVQPCWDAGFTGKGVSVSVLDDGLEWNHTDLRPNFDPFASTDVNDNDSDPFPKYDAYDSNRHGTRCAGEIAMVANNNKCGVGVAYESSIGGIRMLDGPVSDTVEARALSFNLSHIDIFSASWGPADDGRTVDGPGRLAREAFEMGITQGRNGKGVIYVWAAGNGGLKGDNCNCDGYTGSVWTLSIGSASQHGKFPWYGEKCASTLACTYSSGAYTDQKISSTDLKNKCTSDHTGTSAAAPLAAGILALALQANPNITWRDAQHLVVWTSEYKALKKNEGWSTNGIGLKFNSRFGFGLMNADAIVKTARNWTTVPPKSICTVDVDKSLFPLYLAPGNEAFVKFDVQNCKGTKNEVNYIEHVEVRVDIKYKRRGALEIILESPSKTPSDLLFPRSQDFSLAGFKNWTFMSVHMWGENPLGHWTLTFKDNTNESNEGSVQSASLIIHGTKDEPAHLKQSIKKKKSEISNAVEDEEESWEEERDLSPDQHLDWNDLIRMQARDVEDPQNLDVVGNLLL